jgi:hypothetical protein
MTEPNHSVQISEEEFLRQALQVVESARSRHVYLRLIGALAVYVHSLDTPRCISAFKALGRLGEGKPTFTDLDLMGYSKQSKETTKLLQSLNFKPDNAVNWWFGKRRMIYYHPQGQFTVDLFLDKLEFSHDVNFAGRLELDYPTITLEDIVLEKLQIHQINRKDIIDLIVLFTGHNVSKGPAENLVDGEYVARTLSEDWGFWYDATTNLTKVKEMLHELSENSAGITRDEANVATGRVDELLRMIEAMPKTSKWQKTAKVGTKKPWYREVDEVVR